MSIKPGKLVSIPGYIQVNKSGIFVFQIIGIKTQLPRV